MPAMSQGLEAFCGVVATLLETLGSARCGTVDMVGEDIPHRDPSPDWTVG